MNSRRIHFMGAGAALGIIAAAVAPKPAHSQTLTMDVSKGDLVIPGKPFTAVFIADPSIADVNVEGNEQVMVYGKKPGETTLIVSDKKGVLYKGTIKVVAPRIAPPQEKQVSLEVRFVEMRRTFSKRLGINLLAQGNQGNFTFGVTQNVSEAAATTVTLGGIIGSTNLLATIQAGESNGDTKVLATPNLTTMSGAEGKFLAGGETPIPKIAVGGLGGNVGGVDYKEYGVKLNYSPRVLDDGRIQLKIAPEVSQLDYSNAITIQGTRVPGTTTRRAETVVELKDGQSMVIGGLLQNSRANNVTKTPFLGDLPILGLLFRSKAWQNDETELVVVITPRIVKGN